MSTILRWKPSRDLMVMRNEMDRLMESFFNPSPNISGANAWGLALDVVEDENAYEITASIPGLKAEEIDITVEDGVLTIQGETKSTREVQSDDEGENAVRYHLRERRYGRFARSLRLPTDIDVEGIVANHEDGVLTLTLPKAETAKPRRIEIK